jgi:hypothetical protein
MIRVGACRFSNYSEVKGFEKLMTFLHLNLRFIFVDESLEASGQKQDKLQVVIGKN